MSNELRYFDALKRIAKYTMPDTMRRDNERGGGYGLDADEEIAMGVIPLTEHTNSDRSAETVGADEGWQTIETAKPDVRVLVAWEQSPYDDIPWAMQVARKSKWDGEWRDTLTSQMLPFKPTHWRPLSSPPQPAVQGRTE